MLGGKKKKPCAYPEVNIQIQCISCVQWKLLLSRIKDSLNVSFIQAEKQTRIHAQTGQLLRLKLRGVEGDVPHGSQRYILFPSHLKHRRYSFSLSYPISLYQPRGIKLHKTKYKKEKSSRISFKLMDWFSLIHIGQQLRRVRGFASSAVEVFHHTPTKTESRGMQAIPVPGLPSLLSSYHVPSSYCSGLWPSLFSG